VRAHYLPAFTPGDQAIDQGVLELQPLQLADLGPLHLVNTDPEPLKHRPGVVAVWVQIADLGGNGIDLECPRALPRHRGSLAILTPHKQGWPVVAACLDVIR